MVLCPECENNLDLDADDVEEGDVVTCAECDSEFEVITADPLELHLITEEEEGDEDEEADSDDDDDEDDDE